MEIGMREEPMWGRTHCYSGGWKAVQPRDIRGAEGGQIGFERKAGVSGNIRSHFELNYW